MTKTTILKRTAYILFYLALAVVTYYLIAYFILYMNFVFTWQCTIYTGEMSYEGQQVCQLYNEGGLIKVLTN